MKVIGLMSGTSADGVDAALVEVKGAGHRLNVRLLAYRNLSYPRAFRVRLLNTMGHGTVADVCHLNAALGEWFSRAVLVVLRDAGVSPRNVGLIGSHGQTLHHLPVPRHEPVIGAVRSTLQLGEPAVIAERTGIATVGNFRARDMAAGGQGAPLTPYLHHLLFGHRTISRAIVNIGGISNLTYLQAGGDQNAVLAFDTGPGNMVIDGVVSRVTNGRQAFDQGGRLAGRGRPHEALLRSLLKHPYLNRRPPKSTGREEFGESFVEHLMQSARRRGLPPVDIAATATAFTARTIAGAKRFLRGPVQEVLICGGGARNFTLMRMLQIAWGATPVRPVEALGWNGRALEATAFAVFAYQAMHGIPCNLPSVTGARRPVVLGAMVPGTKAPKLSF